MKKVSTIAAEQSRDISQQKLTIGLDLGDRNSWFCVVDETGKIQLEQQGQKHHLTPTGLLMEGDYTHLNKFCGQQLSPRVVAPDRARGDVGHRCPLRSLPMLA